MDYAAPGKNTKLGKPRGESGKEIDESNESDCQVEVYVKIAFLKLGEIKTLDETFTADVFIQSRWREPGLDNERGVDGDLPDGMALWDPMLNIANALNIKEDAWHTVKYGQGGQAYVCQKRRVNGTFYERMELRKFPFDTQDLTVTLSSDRGEHEVCFFQDPFEESAVNVQSFVEEQEWQLRTRMRSWKKVNTNVYQSSKHKHPAISISATVTRRSRFFFWNVILIMIFLSSLSFSTFVVDREKVENRLQLSFILLLSNITFKFTINQNLPKVSYLTLMDKYIIGSMLHLCLVCCWHAIVSCLTGNSEDARLADIIAGAMLAGGYFIFNVVFLVVGLMIKREQRSEERKESQHPLAIGKSCSGKPWPKLKAITPAVSSVQIRH